MKHMTVGADIAKNVMQLHYIDAETGDIVNKPASVLYSSSISRTGLPA